LSLGFVGLPSDILVMRSLKETRSKVARSKRLVGSRGAVEREEQEPKKVSEVLGV